MVEKNLSQNEKSNDIFLASFTLISRGVSSQLENPCSILSNRDNWNHKILSVNSYHYS